MSWIQEKAGTNTPPKNPPVKPSRGNKIIREGCVKKGGVNQMSKTPRPAAPIGIEPPNIIMPSDYVIYGFNCCGEIIEFPNFRGLAYGKR